jgi:micrococcal nuclease
MIGGKDIHGRTVAKVFTGNTSINLSLVQEGQAVVYRQYLGGCPELRDRLLSAKVQAKRQRLGLWAQANPVMPWEFRKSGSASVKARPETQRLNTSLTRQTLGAPALQPKPAKDYKCIDFRTQAEAQRVFDAYPGDPFKLD